MPRWANCTWFRTAANRLRELTMPAEDPLLDVGFNRALIDRPEYRILPRDRAGSVTGHQYPPSR